jgi:hypothetical protein
MYFIVLQIYNKNSCIGRRCKPTKPCQYETDLYYVLAGCNEIPSYCVRSISNPKVNSRRESMKAKINEDWLATILAFVLMFLAIVNVIQPGWVKF